MRLGRRAIVACLAIIIVLGSCSERKEKPTAFGFKVHPPQWMQKQSADFHAQKVATLGIKYCGECHGADYRGGKSAVSCYTCHGGGPSGHPEGWLDTHSANFHGVDIKTNGWDLSRCQVCHGTDYAGGTSGTSCLSCHPGTPEACNTCHGSSQNPAPPEDVEGHTATTFKGVGAHQTHLNEGELSKGFDCSMCHIVPQIFSDAGHVDSNLPAEIHFGDLATDSGKVSPLWDGVSTCSDVYCHGEFPLGNKDTNPQWTLVGAGQAACGTCHGLPPGGQHPAVNKCYLCHANVVDQDNTIIDKEKHINGNTDF